ncbi:MAG: 6,7-dimethyl-8-ribityllumazine synthase, partial [Planctomycetaceae bacterium]|nr:6,7-dimethyl-8-ribityllumazine synthase [Planctomycetaceae bacterium]
TSHDEHINRAVSLEIAKVATETNKPVVFGVLTCNTVEQAEARSGAKEQTKDKTIDPTAGNKGAEAAEVALEMIDLLSEIPEPKTPFDDMFSGFMDSLNGEEDDDVYDYWDDDEGMFDILPPPKKKKKKGTGKKSLK